MKIISARENPEQIPAMTAYIQSHWASPESMDVYTDCIAQCAVTKSPLPEWYVIEDGGNYIGCAGLISNDFISRSDLWPWFCALFIEPDYRGHALGSTLMERASADAKKAGFTHIYLCTDHIGYYEKYGFGHIGTGYHPWGETSRIYEKQL